MNSSKLGKKRKAQMTLLRTIFSIAVMANFIPTCLAYSTQMFGKTLTICESYFLKCDKIHTNRLSKDFPPKCSPKS